MNVSEVEPDILLLPDGSICHKDMFSQRYSRGIASFEIRSNKADRRLECERDVGRIRYSAALLRLSGVTQVTSPDPRITRRHDRLAHTLKVAGLAREIANDIVRSARNSIGKCNNTEDRKRLDAILEFGGLDISACEAGGLGHDLGHAPFAHSSQDILDNWLLEVGDTCGFEGNAQSLRVVTRLEPRKPEMSGLGLTAVSIGAMQKYPWIRDRSNPQRSDKFSVYRDDIACLELGQGVLPHNFRDGRQTLEAAIVDLADDITYAIHDVQDFIEAGLLDFRRLESEITGLAKRFFYRGYAWPTETSKDECHGLEILAARVARQCPGLMHPHELGTALMYINKILGDIDHIQDTSYGTVAGIRNTLSGIISDIVGSITISSPSNNRILPVTPGVAEWHRLQAMKFIGRHYAIGSPQVARQEQSNRAALRSTLNALLDWTTSAPIHTLPSALRESIEKVCIPAPRKDSPALRRAIVDYLCGLTDRSCLDLAAELCGWRIPRA